MNAIVTAWAVIALAVAAALLAASRRLGRRRAAASLVVQGVVLLVVEEPALTLWLAMTDPTGDPDGVVGLVTPMARAHILDAAGFSLAAAVLLGGIALTAFRRGEPWARRILLWGFAVAATATVATSVFVYSRGLPLPVPARSGSFGWQPVAVGLLAWAAGLWLTRAVHDGRHSSTLTATRDIAVTPRQAWTAILSADGTRQWFPGASAVETDPDWPEPGTHMRWTVPSQLRFDATVVTADPPTHIALDVHTPTAHSRVTYAFAELPTGQTRYTKTVTPTYRGWARIAKPLLNTVLRWSIRVEVARAARYAALGADRGRPSAARH